MNAIKEKEYGLDVIYRHDYDKVLQGNNISQYILQSCQYLEKFLSNVPNAKNFRVFWDIGCGNSQAIQYFKDCRYALESYGVDKYPQEENKCVRKGNFYELEESMRGIPKPDVIFVNHTLEHSLAPLLLEQIRKVHKIGGVLFVAVPNADYPWAYEITSSTTHWSIFNEGFLRTLLQRYGYEVVVEKKCFRDNCGELFAVGIKRW